MVSPPQAPHWNQKAVGMSLSPLFRNQYNYKYFSNDIVYAGKYINQATSAVALL
jgi:hypothetical protein